MKFVFALVLLVAFVAVSSAQAQSERAHQERVQEKRVEAASSTVAPATQSSTASPLTTVSQSTSTKVNGVPEAQVRGGNVTEKTGRTNDQALNNESINLKSFSMITLASLALLASKLF